MYIHYRDIITFKLEQYVYLLKYYEALNVNTQKMLNLQLSCKHQKIYLSWFSHFLLSSPWEGHTPDNASDIFPFLNIIYLECKLGIFQISSKTDLIYLNFGNCRLKIEDERERERERYVPRKKQKKVGERPGLSSEQSSGQSEQSLFPSWGGHCPDSGGGLGQLCMITRSVHTACYESDIKLQT